MDRHWLLTWTTYGTWLPGDRRGFVSNVAGPGGRGVRHNTPGTPYAADAPELRDFARRRQTQPAVWLTADQATAVVGQFRETATYRGWQLLAAAAMANHVHLVVGVPGDPDPGALLRDFKSYGARRLNHLAGQTARWWTQSGSRRKLPDAAAVNAAVRYVRRQQFPLAVWTPDDPPLAPSPRPHAGTAG